MKLIQTTTNPSNEPLPETWKEDMLQEHLLSLKKEYNSTMDDIHSIFMGDSLTWEEIMAEHVADEVKNRLAYLEKVLVKAGMIEQA